MVKIMQEAASHYDPSQRQVLVNLGNRWVVFGSNVTLPRALHFSPVDGKPSLPRVAHETEHAGERILETLRVSDGKVKHGPRQQGPDLEIIDRDGNRTFVEVKVREREPSSRDFEQILNYLRKEHGDSASRIEVWNFNIERLKLHIFASDARGLARHIELVPLNVWEYGPEGAPFERSRVLARVEDWENRVNALYGDVEKWAEQMPGLRSDRTRSVEMSEELMQKFAVPDRELPVLDILRGDEAVASFVPRGLWLIKYNGRIDIITAAGTRVLLDAGEKGTVQWNLADPTNKSFVRFDESAFKNVLCAA
jgi:hypothetical protein